MTRPDFRLNAERVGVATLTLLAAVLLFKNLGNQYLWQDEAQTALIARTVLTHGIPLGTDGRNYFSQEEGIEYGDNYIWKWHTWLSFYLVAASYLVFGVNTFAARFPFALFGLATVLLSYYTARLLWRDRYAAAATAMLMLLCVPFLVASRQARWYSIAAFFTLLGVHAYGRLRSGERGPELQLFLAATLLFHTHYIYCATLLATLLIHAGLFERPKLRSVFLVCGVVTLFNAPWIVWFSTVRYGENYGERVLELKSAVGQIRAFVLHLDNGFPISYVLFLLPVIAGIRWLKRESVLDVSLQTRTNVLLIVVLLLVNILILGFLSPDGHFRYIAPIGPAAVLVVGLVVGTLSHQSRALGVVAIAVYLATGTMRGFVREITHDFDGPIEGIVTFLNARGTPDDVVAISYGDLPVKFYTKMRVVGGLTGEDLSPARDADWIVLRQRVNTVVDRRVKEQLLAILRREKYTRHTIDYPDTLFENRETPHLHRFWTASPSVPRVTIYEKQR